MYGKTAPAPTVAASAAQKESPKPIVEQKNVELDASEAADLYSNIGFETGEKLEGKDEKYVLSESSPTPDESVQVITSEATENDDLSLPQWPSYDSPVTQLSEIKKELADVKKSGESFSKRYAEASKQQESATDATK